MKLSYNDKEHAYWLDGKRCKGVTSVASYPDDKYAINQWRARNIVTGMALSPPLVHRAVAHFDERDKLQDIAEEALAIAKAHEAAGRGTANHRITERVDRGLTVIETDETGAITEAWQTALERAGLEIVPELIERIVVYPDQLIAGTFDRIARYRTTGRHVGVDIKTGANAIRYPHSVCIQVALYVNAPLMAGPLQPGHNGTGWTTDFEPLPDDIHRDHAIVVYLPPEGPAQTPRIDIAAGWQAAQDICFPTIAWRNRTDLVEHQIPAVIDPTELVHPDAHTWLKDRVQFIKAAGHGPALAAAWSRHIDIPTFPRGGPRTRQEFDVIDKICDDIEAQNDMPFGTSNPTSTPQTKQQKQQRKQETTA